MKERPILFSAPMVRALLAGTKTQTRRLCKPQPIADERFVGGHYLPATARNPGQEISVEAPYVHVACPYGQPGDRLWVRETWSPSGPEPSDGSLYRADFPEGPLSIKFKPSIHMPRWASRITLEITSVRVERLQDISDADCVAEGCGALPSAIGCPMTSPPGETIPRTMFRALWESINGPASWDANPWVWAVSFKRVA